MKKFTRTIEDFTCEYCGTNVKGNGYTNHCPQCLYSKHVDIQPGDRAAKCGGLMKPITIHPKGDEYTILHRCEKCGHEKSNKTTPDDNFETVLKITLHNN